MDGDFRPQAEVIPAQAPGGAPCVSAACSSSGMLPQLAEAEVGRNRPAGDTVAKPGSESRDVDFRWDCLAVSTGRVSGDLRAPNATTQSCLPC